MNPYLKSSLRWLSLAAIVTVLWLLYGCASVVAPRPYHVTAKVTTEVHIVTDRAGFSIPEYRDSNPRNQSRNIAGYADMREGVCHIYVLGYEYKGRIYPMTAEILGHEFQHCLNMVNPAVLDPDTDYKWWMGR
jgi:hypothetical protein